MISKLPSYLLVACLLPNLAYGQILAGTHSSNDYYFDFDPDSTVIAEWGETSNVVSLPLDLNGDQIFDFSLDVTHSNGALGSSFQYVLIEAHNGNQIAYGATDTCLGMEPFCSGEVHTFPMVELLNVNDVIDENTVWGSDTTYYIRYQRQSLNCLSCNPSGPEAALVGLRINQPADTLYGWISLSEISVGSAISRFTIEDMACEMDNVGLQEKQNRFSIGPNPCDNQLIVRVNNNYIGQNLMIYDLMGSLALASRISSPSTNFDVAGLANGTYLISLQGNTGSLGFQKLVIHH